MEINKTETKYTEIQYNNMLTKAPERSTNQLVDIHNTAAIIFT